MKTFVNQGDLGELFVGFAGAREKPYICDCDKRPIRLIRYKLECLTVTRDYNVVYNVVISQDRVSDGYECASRGRHAC